MKEEKTSSKKKVLYYVALAFGVLLLVAATVLTVYFVRESNEVLEAPPADEPIDDGPVSGGEEQQPPTSGGDVNEPDEPSGGETEQFVAPIENTPCSVVYNEIYYNETLGWIYRHKAVDFVADAGTDVHAMADGVIESVSKSEETGNLVVVNHGGDLRTYYRFVEPNDQLVAGAKVQKGEKIGTVANAYGIERHNGTHLHFEIKLGKDYADPAEYLENVLQEK